MQELITLRKELHRYPELSGFEKETAKRVENFLRKYSPDELITNVGGYGIIAVYNGESDGHTILFRADMDALPIQEANEFEYKSVFENVSHKCGHDGHTTILCGVAKKLSKNKPKKGKVILLFQPAEEIGMGANAIINDEKFKPYPPGYAFALHNLPGYKRGTVVVKNNTFTCAVNSIIIILRGKTSHAAEPEHGTNPALAISEIVQAFENKNRPDMSRDDFSVLTPVHINLGTKDYGISAGYGEIHYTFRRNKNDLMQDLENELVNIVNTVAAKYHLKADIDWTQKYKANENNKEAVNVIRQAIQETDLSLIEKQTPFKWGEDFGLFTERFKGAMFGLGSGENIPALHNPDYDFPDEIIEDGVSIFYQISKVFTDA